MVHDVYYTIYYLGITLCERKFTKEIQFSKFLYNFRLLSFYLEEERYVLSVSVEHSIYK